MYYDIVRSMEESEDSDINLKGEKSNTFKCLGSTAADDSDLNEEITRRVQ